VLALEQSFAELSEAANTARPVAKGNVEEGEA
jgi:hypothetical protein